MKWLTDILKGNWLGHPLHPIFAHVPMAMNSRFDVRTGKVTQGPAKVDLKTFKVEIREGKVGVVLEKRS